MDFPIFQTALDVAAAKELFPTSLSSAELRELDAAIRRRAVFSAKLDKAGVLTVFKRQIELIASGERDEFGRLRSVPEAMQQLREAMLAAGMADGDGGLTDHLSEPRRRLMVETMMLDTMNHARWLDGQNEIALDVNPAWELVRMVEPLGTRRDWEERWREAAAATTLDGATDPDTGRMVALKNHPIWQALGDGAGGYEDTLGNPWPPFAFNSGMAVIDVDREDAVALGLISETAAIPPAREAAFNGELEASAENLDIAALGDLAGYGMGVVDGVLRLLNSRVYQRDHLGRFDGNGSALPPKENIRRGNRAVAEAMNKKRDVQKAMQVRGLGAVDFEWGRPGTPKRNAAGASHYDGYGLSHILAKRGPRALRALPLVLSKGKISPHPDDPKRRVIKYNGWTAIVKKHNQRKSYVVTHIDDDVVMRNRKSRLPVSFPLRSIGSRGSWEPSCGMCPTHAAPFDGEGGAVASKALNIAQARAGLQALLCVLERRAA